MGTPHAKEHASDNEQSDVAAPSSASQQDGWNLAHAGRTPEGNRATPAHGPREGPSTPGRCAALRSG